MACLYPSIVANLFLVALCNRRRPQYLYDKECILENILKQKADMKRQMKEYEAQLRKHQARQAKTDAEAKDAAFEQFVKKERGIGGASADGSVNAHAILVPQRTLLECCVLMKLAAQRVQVATYTRALATPGALWLTRALVKERGGFCNGSLILVHVRLDALAKQLYFVHARDCNRHRSTALARSHRSSPPKVANLLHKLVHRYRRFLLVHHAGKRRNQDTHHRQCAGNESAVCTRRGLLLVLGQSVALAVFPAFPAFPVFPGLFRLAFAFDVRNLFPPLDRCVRKRRGSKARALVRVLVWDVIVPFLIVRCQFTACIRVGSGMCQKPWNIYY